MFTHLLEPAAKSAINTFMEQQHYYIVKLKEHLSQRQKANPAYSLRAYADFLDIHSSTLSQIFKQKRALPFKRADGIANKLNLSPKEKTLFMESFYRSKTNIDKIEIAPLDDRFILDESYFNAIAQWEHFAVLELFNIQGCNVSVDEIVKRFGISTTRAEVVLNNLIQSKLIIQGTEGQLLKNHPDIKTTEDITSKALQESHKETLEMGKNKLTEIAVELRDFSSTTVAVDLNKLPEAKTIIREFRQKMTALLRDGEKTDVFQLAIQFYPLTTITSMENKNE